MPTKNNHVVLAGHDDHFVSDLIDERDRVLACNRHLSDMVQVQDQDLQAASATIDALVANAQETIQRLHSEIATLKQLITDAYNVHFGYEKNIGNDEWMNLSVSTLADMQSIAQEKKGGQS